MGRKSSVYNILNRKHDVFEFGDEWEEAFGQPEKTGLWFISGLPTNGKTAFCMQLTHKLAQMGSRTAYFAFEEGRTLPFKNSIIRHRWADFTRRIVVEEDVIPFSKYADWILRNPRIKAVIIDTIQKWDLKKSNFPKLYELMDKKLLIINSHVKSNGYPDGAVANALLRDAQLKIWVEGFRAISRGRTFGDVGYYTIWRERAEKYWAEKLI